MLSTGRSRESKISLSLPREFHEQFWKSSPRNLTNPFRISQKNSVDRFPPNSPPLPVYDPKKTLKAILSGTTPLREEMRAKLKFPLLDTPSETIPEELHEGTTSYAKFMLAQDLHELQVNGSIRSSIAQETVKADGDKSSKFDKLTSESNTNLVLNRPNASQYL